MGTWAGKIFKITKQRIELTFFGQNKVGTYETSFPAPMILGGARGAGGFTGGTSGATHSS